MAKNLKLVSFDLKKYIVCALEDVSFNLVLPITRNEFIRRIVFSRSSRLLISILEGGTLYLILLLHSNISKTNLLG